MGDVRRPPGATKDHALPATLPADEWWDRIDAWLAARQPDPASFQFADEVAPYPDLPGIEKDEFVSGRLEVARTESKRPSFKMTLTQDEIERIKERVAEQQKAYEARLREFSGLIGT